MLTSIFACPKAVKAAGPPKQDTLVFACGCFFEDDDVSSDCSDASSDSGCTDPFVSAEDEEDIFSEDESETDTVIPSYPSTAVATPRVRDDEKLSGSVQCLKIVTSGSFESIQEASEEPTMEDLNEMIFKSVARDQITHPLAVPATPDNSPIRATADFKWPKDAEFVELVRKLENLPLALKARNEPDRHLQAFDLIPFPTFDFDTPLVSHPACKPKAVVNMTGAGRSGFCNSFKSVALQNAAVC